MMADELPGVPLSITDPYVPLFRAQKVPGMDRPSTREEAVEAKEIATAVGVETIE